MVNIMTSLFILCWATTLVFRFANHDLCAVYGAYCNGFYSLVYVLSKTQVGWFVKPGWLWTFPAIYSKCLWIAGLTPELGMQLLPNITRKSLSFIDTIDCCQTVSAVYYLPASIRPVYCITTWSTLTLCLLSAWAAHAAQPSRRGGDVTLGFGWLRSSHDWPLCRHARYDSQYVCIFQKCINMWLHDQIYLYVYGWFSK